MMNDIENLVSQLGNQLSEKKLTLVTAESCTGGGLAYYISINPNASSRLERGYVTYSSHAKQSLLGVAAGTLQLCGAVSKETAIEMAKGALKNSAAQIAIAITGIAGEDKTPESDHKNMGVVWVCCCSAVNANILIEKITVAGTRKKFCDETIMSCIKLLIKYINDIS